MVLGGNTKLATFHSRMSDKTRSMPCAGAAQWACSCLTFCKLSRHQHSLSNDGSKGRSILSHDDHIYRSLLLVFANLELPEARLMLPSAPHVCQTLQHLESCVPERLHCCDVNLHDNGTGSALEHCHAACRQVGAISTAGLWWVAWPISRTNFGSGKLSTCQRLA